MDRMPSHSVPRPANRLAFGPIDQLTVKADVPAGDRHGIGDTGGHARPWLHL
jgi:hypothetical protein